ncbi:hypothetical protein L6452_42218 [Arctium lappa]|uniref:Uncharacterized protein n=1 Tax=Arctium lappa TaxID=4217 RepID=A0ACB8XIC6_ARCLA|nr:hypothetical protein L6452_42218 [Arctium lappa]
MKSSIMSAYGFVSEDCKDNGSFAEPRMHHFMANGKPLYFNGFNAFWLMCMASDPSTKTKVTDSFKQASKLGMNVVRTWAFSDGCSKPLQTSPGCYNEDMFKARDHGGQYLNSDDEIFSNVVVKGYYKNHVKSVLTRCNSIMGVAYKDDPTIFAWELMNEPRCQSDLSGKLLQEWIVEMAAEIKSIDKNHLLEIGLEGVPGSDEARAEFVEKWINFHIEDCKSILVKPLLIAEFGKSSTSAGYTVEARDEYFGTIFNMVYECARTGGSCSGTTFWKVMAEGMENWGDGYQVVLEQNPSTCVVIAQQSQKISSLNS